MISLLNMLMKHTNPDIAAFTGQSIQTHFDYLINTHILPIITQNRTFLQLNLTIHARRIFAFPSAEPLIAHLN